MSLGSWPFRVLLALFLSSPATAAESTADRDGVRAQGRALTGWLYAADVDRLWPRLSLALREHFVDRDGLRAFAVDLDDQLGQETEVLDDQVIPWLGSAIYHRTAAFSETGPPVWVQWTLAPDGTVLGVFVRPAEEPAPSRHLDYETQTPLRLPFEGQWFVYWGGRSVLENYHAASRGQRFAYDFLIAREGSTHAGDPARNDSYHCFGQPVLAPAAGTVVALAGGIPDNPPGRMNRQRPLGNHVVLDHGNGEFSFLAHLRQDSITVERGQRVAAGDVVGRCGNSGRSSEPHLHYHLQTTAEFGAGEGLPARFIDYRADGDPVARGEPTRGQRVAPE
jgi:hypothetical protein